jgi:hypothetical protein
MRKEDRVRLRMLPAILFVIGALIASAQTSGNIARWVVEKNSTLQVAGKSNVNSFVCEINRYDNRDTIQLYGSTNQSIRLTGDLQMDVLNFDCHSSMINKDMQKTLKADVYPELKIRFLSLQSMPNFQARTEQIKGILEVELAGVIKRFEMMYTITRINNNFIQMSGNKNFTFSDFKLAPPQKFAGLIKIKDDFNVNFQLVLRAL